MLPPNDGYGYDREVPDLGVSGEEKYVTTLAEMLLALKYNLDRIELKLDAVLKTVK